MPHREKRWSPPPFQNNALRFKTTSILIAPSCHAHSPKNTFWLSCLQRKKIGGRGRSRKIKTKVLCCFLKEFSFCGLWNVKFSAWLLKCISPQKCSIQSFKFWRFGKIVNGKFFSVSMRFGSNNWSAGGTSKWRNHLQLLINKHKRNWKR